MTPRILLGVACLLVGLALVGGKVADTVRGAGPRETAVAFLDAVVSGDLTTAAALSTQPVTATSGSLASLPHVAAEVTTIERTGPTATAEARLANANESVPLRLRLRETPDGWRVESVQVLVAPQQRQPADPPTDALRAIEGVDIGTF